MRFLSTFFSICLHVGIVVAVLYWPATTMKVRLDVPAYKVKLVALAKKSPAPVKAAATTVKKQQPKKAEPKQEAKKAAPEPAKKETPKTQVKAKPKAKPVSAKKEKPKKAVAKKKKAPKKKAVKKADTKKKAKKKTVKKKKTPPKSTPDDILRKALASTKTTVKKDKQKKISDLEKELASLQKSVAKDDVKKGEQGIEGIPQDGVIGSIEDLYALSVLATIKPNWRYPKLATRTVLVAQVRIMISQKGDILDAKLISSSGRPDFDSSTLRAIADTERLPTPPSPDLNEITLNFNSQEQ